MLHRSNQLVLACIGIISGIGLGTGGIFLPEQTRYLLIGIGVCIVLVHCILPRQQKRIITIILISGAIGMVYTSAETQNHLPYEEWVQFTGTVVEEPELRLRSQRIIVEAEALNATIQLSTLLQPRYTFGDILKVSCRLQQPEPFEGFQYDKYLERYGITGLCYYPGVTQIGAQIGAKESIKRNILQQKRRLTIQLQHTVAAPEHTIILGALFGMKKAVPEQVMNAFRTTGTSHLLVISGLHISLLINMLERGLLIVPIHKKQRIILVVLIILGYVSLTGWQASATRAALLGSSSLIAELLGRRTASLRILLLVGTGMLIHNPLLLLYDTGFQLSFLASGGIIVFTPWVQERMSFVPKKFGIQEGLAVSTAAIVSTAPIIAYSFHQFSPVAFIANIVLVPLMPFILIGGMAAIVIGGILPTSIATWFVLPVYGLLHSMLVLVQWFAAIPYASVSITEMSTPVLIAGLASIGLAGLYVQHQRYVQADHR